MKMSEYEVPTVLSTEGAQEVVILWLDQRVEFDPAANGQATALWADYAAWAQTTGQPAMTQTRFGKALFSLDIVRVRTRQGMVYPGLRLRAEEG